MKISIITITFNSKNCIQHCLNSILQQSYEDIELIIVDGQSQDNTFSIVEDLLDSYSNKILISESDNGIYDALNKGIKLSNGDVLGFVHSDDLLASPLIVSEIVEKISKENLDGVYGNLNYVQKSNVNKIVRKWKSNDFDYDLLKKGWMPAHPTFFLKKSVYEKHGLFNLNYSISADYDFMIRVLSDRSLKFGYLPKVITKMRVGGESNRSLKNIILKTKEDYLIIKRNNIGNFLTLIRKNTSKFKQFF